jgi:hypothetical protein
LRLSSALAPQALLLGCAVAACAPACERAGEQPTGVTPGAAPGSRGAAPEARPVVTPKAVWAGKAALAPGQTLALGPQGARVIPIAEAEAAGLLDVDLSDEWAPFIFSESDGPGTEPRPNGYRRSFIDLANDRVDEDDLYFQGAATRFIDYSPEAIERRRLEEEERKRLRRKGIEPKPKPPRKHTEPIRNYLEVYGIPPTLTVLLRRLEEDAPRTCYASVDLEALRQWKGTALYLNHKQVKQELDQASADEAWLRGKVQGLGADAGAPDAAVAQLAKDPRIALRVERALRGQQRVRAIKAVQQRLTCEGLIGPRTKVTPGMLDLATHQALADWERKNDIFGWGFVGDETQEVLQRPPAELHLEALRRVLTERIADAAAILEDGSVSGGKKPATWKDLDGTVRPVPDLLKEHVDALLTGLGIRTPEDAAAFLRDMAKALPHLHVAFAPPALPAYYVASAGSAQRRFAELDLEVDIDRGDVWYDFPFDANGKAIEQRRERFPQLTVFVKWNKQRIPIARWRTTIGSWRSELHADGKVYFKYKQSDVGPRIWKDIVAGPVWVPPDGTPAKDLLTKKTLERTKPPATVVNTDVMGPGFQSAYGLVMAIHHEVRRKGYLFDNQIRTHGSVDYTSIARRFSHGCHRLVNTRAVRLFGFVLRHRAFVRKGQSPLHMKKIFVHEAQKYGYEMTTRGYYYELTPPIAVNVLEGRIMGEVKKPIVAFIRKPGVDYSEDVLVESGEAAPGAPGTRPLPPVLDNPNAPPIETKPVVGP